MKIVIGGGKARGVYSDHSPLREVRGDVNISRASTVEPWAHKYWKAYIQGTDVVLGPFLTHAEALAAEVKYLERNVL